MVKPLLPSLVPNRPAYAAYEEPAPGTLEAAMAALVIVWQAPRRLARGAYRTALQATGYDEKPQKPRAATVFERWTQQRRAAGLCTPPRSTASPAASTASPSKPASEASSDASKDATEGQHSPSSVLFATPLSKVAQQVRRRLLGGARAGDESAAASDSESVASHPLAPVAAEPAPPPRAAHKALALGAAVALAAAAAVATGHRRHARSPDRRRVSCNRFPEPREVPFPKPAAFVAAK